MILIIPALHIANGKCLRTAEGAHGTEGRYPSDPRQVARLWRGENAKALHVVVTDMDQTGIRAQQQMLREIVTAVDIPLQLAGGFSDVEDVRIAIEDIGVYRVVIDFPEERDPAFIPELLDRYGPRKIVIAMEIEDGMLCMHGRRAEFDALDSALHLKERGVQRVIITDSGARARGSGPDTDMLLLLAERTNLSITLNGSVRHFHDLRIIQDLHPRKIDSIILDEALYSNSFPCQKIWRMVERELIAQHKLL
ncbi:MAG: hypothetical protein JXA28_12240 [Bacteroidetes bacterium]|nr:hypothetical protein [Bacteroidota bacterium]